MCNLLSLVWMIAIAHSACAAEPSAAATPDGAEPMNEALKTGATAAQLFLSYLKPYATTEFPGTLAWMSGAGAAIAALDKDHPTESWRSLNPDSLITHNAAWWEAYYEVAPGDPGLALLHGSTLLCAGDAQRAMQVLRIALNHQELDAGSAKIVVTII